MHPCRRYHSPIRRIVQRASHQGHLCCDLDRERKDLEHGAGTEFLKDILNPSLYATALDHAHQFEQSYRADGDRFAALFRIRENTRLFPR